MNQSASILRKGRKFHQVLAGAREVFMADGFEGASVDDIARAAGVSKATLYTYFPDKRLLFTEVAQTECARLAETATAQIDDRRPPRDVLMVVGRQLVRFLLSDFAQQVFRICVAERERFPELGRAFYASGPEMGQKRLAEYLTCAAGRGELAMEGEAWDCNALDPLALDNVHIQQLVRARWGDRGGVGIVEQLCLGPHATSGFAGFLDGAP